MTVSELIKILEKIPNKNLQVITCATYEDYTGDVCGVTTDFWYDTKNKKIEYCEIISQ